MKLNPREFRELQELRRCSVPQMSKQKIKRYGQLLQRVLYEYRRDLLAYLKQHNERLEKLHQETAQLLGEVRRRKEAADANDDVEST